MTIDFREDAVAKRLLKAVGAELSEFCDLHHMKHIVQVTAVRCDGRECMMMLRLIQVEQDSAKPSDNVLSKEGALYSKFCHRVNMRPEWLYKSFKEGHHDYEVWGLVPLGVPLDMNTEDASDPENQHLYCEDFIVVCRRDDGLVYLYPANAICEKMEGGAL